MLDWVLRSGLLLRLFTQDSEAPAGSRCADEGRSFGVGAADSDRETDSAQVQMYLQTLTNVFTDPHMHEHVEMLMGCQRHEGMHGQK